MAALLILEIPKRDECYICYTNTTIKILLTIIQVDKNRECI